MFPELETSRLRTDTVEHSGNGHVVAIGFIHPEATSYGDPVHAAEALFYFDEPLSICYRDLDVLQQFLEAIDDPVGQELPVQQFLYCAEGCEPILVGGIHPTADEVLRAAAALSEPSDDVPAGPGLSLGG